MAIKSTSSQAAKPEALPDSQTHARMARALRNAYPVNRTGVFIVFVNQGVFHTTLGNYDLIKGTDYIIRE